MASAAENITRAYNGDWHGSYGLIPTPGHGPKDRGTSVKDADDGDVVVNSFNGGDWRSLKEEFRAKGLLEERRVIKPMAANDRGGWRQTGEYRYADATGNMLYRTLRTEHPREGKKFKAQRLEESEWRTGLDPKAPRVPYRLSDIVAADRATVVLFVEGERKADKLAELGFVATAIAFGANGWRDDYARHFADRTVVILPDNDDPGRAFADKVEAALTGVSARVVQVELPGLPPKGDIVDWAPRQDDPAARLRELIDKALHQPVATFPIADLSLWSGIEATPKAFVVPGFIPAREVTLLTGKGGGNKSTFGQQLATCAAAGTQMLGLDVQPGPALYITAEDDDDRLHWMQQHLCRAVGADMATLSGKLFLSSLRGRLGNELATFDGEGKLRPAPSFGVLKATLVATKAKLVVLDNVAHLFTGNENDRGQVTAFVNMLYSLCVELGVTIVLIAHTNKAGDTYSGSTAWLNAVRSQVVIERPEDTFDPDLRVARLGKANYARPDETLEFRWHDFALVRDEDLPDDVRAEVAASAAAAAANGRFLELLDKTREEKRAVSASRAARNFAPRIFAGMTGARGMTEAAFEGALERLLHLGEIVAEGRVHQRENRAWVSGIVRTEVAPTIAPTMHQPGAQTRTTQHHQPAPSTHPPLKGGMGAACAGPAPIPQEPETDLSRVVFAEGKRWAENPALGRLRTDQANGASSGEILAPGELPTRGWL